jgi:hypothetical protein
MPWARFREMSCAAVPRVAVHLPTDEPTSAAAAPASITRNAGLAFTPGEPACNVYTSGGQFTPHEDGQSLTVIVVLSDRDTFVGGGTRFWSKTSPKWPEPGAA